MSRVSSGTPVGRLLRAGVLNHVLEGADLAHRSGGGAVAASLTSGRTVLVKNATSSDLDRFAVLGLTDVLIDPSQSEDAKRSFLGGVSFVGSTPDTERDGAGRVAIVQAPCEKAKLVPAVVSGLSIAYVDLPDSETYTEADLIHGDHTQLAVGSGPIVVVWHEQGPGKKLAVVNLGAGGGSCPYYWELYVDGNPSSGACEFQIEVGGITETIEVTWNDDVDDIKSELVGTFPTKLTTDNLIVIGGPLPAIHVYILWPANVDVPFTPVPISNTLNSGTMKIAQINPR